MDGYKINIGKVKAFLHADQEQLGNVIGKKKFHLQHQ